MLGTGARARAGLKQAELAERMGTSQSAVARLESGKGRPSVATLEKLAQATGSKLRIALEAA
ncbi:helix-turn-helix domain-containing protein [Tsuneonella aeria]